MNPNFVKKIFKVFSGNVISAVIFFLFYIILADSLSMVQFGLFAILYTLALLFADLSDFGTGANALLNESFLTARTSGTQFTILSSTRFTFFATASPFLFVFYFLDFVTFLSALSVFLCAYAMALRILLQTEFRFRGKYWKLGLSQIVDRSMTLALFLLIQPTTAHGSIFVVAFSSFSVLLLFRWKPQVKYSFVELILFYKQSKSLGMSSILSDLALLDILLLAATSGSDGLARYSFVVRFCAPLLLVGASISLVTVKEFNVDRRPGKDLAFGIKRLFLLIFVTCLPLSVLIGFAHSYISRNYVFEKYGNTQALLVAALLGSLFLVLWQGLAAVLQSQLMFATNLRFTFCIAFAYLSAVLILGGISGELAIPLAQVSVYLVAIMLGIRFLSKSKVRN